MRRVPINEEKGDINEEKGDAFAPSVSGHSPNKKEATIGVALECVPYIIYPTRITSIEYPTLITSILLFNTAVHGR